MRAECVDLLVEVPVLARTRPHSAPYDTAMALQAAGQGSYAGSYAGQGSYAGSYAGLARAHTNVLGTVLHAVVPGSPLWV